MKKTLLIAAIAIISASSVHAQEQSAQDNQNDVRPHFVNNKWYDNIFIGASGGIATQFGKEIVKSHIDPTVKLSVIKWFSPIVGFRVEAQNTWIREGLSGYNPYHQGNGHSYFPYKLDKNNTEQATNAESGTLEYGNMFASASLLWNLTELFGSYEPDRLWNISAYIQGGYSHLYHATEGIRSKSYDREYSLGIGLFNTFSITERLHASLDFDFAGYSANYRTTKGYLTMSPSLTVGIAYNIFKTNWKGTRFDPYAFVTPVADTREIDALTRQLADRDKTLKDLQDQLGNAQDNLNKTDAALKALKSQPHVEKQYKAFFELDKSSITFAERQHIRQFVQGAIKKNADQKFRLAGSADKGTGSFDHNIVLAADRAESIKKFMVEELGVKAENITLAEPLVTDSQMDASFNRSVLIECL